MTTTRNASGDDGRRATRRRRRRTLLVSAIAGALALTGCSSAADPGGAASGGRVDLAKVTLRVGDQKGTGAEAILRAAGLLNTLPFRISWSDFTSGPPMLQAIGSGAVDIGGIGDAPPVFAAAGHEQITLVGARTTPAAAAALVVPAGSPITTIAQLRGKRIAVSQGSSAEYHLLTVLRAAGLSVHDVTLDNLQPAEALAAFNSGHVDAWDIWSPYIEQATGQYHARVLVNGGAYGSNNSFEAASRSALRDPSKAAAIRDYLTVLNQAYRWSATHTTTWARLWAAATGLPAGIMLTAAKDDVNVPEPISSEVISSEQHLADAFYTAGLIPDQVTMSGYVVTSFNATAKGAAS